MSPRGAQPGKAHGRRRRTVRIIDKSRVGSRAVLISLIVAGAGALSFPIVWHLTHHPREQAPSRPQQRLWEWKCEDGHTFEAPFQLEPRKCPHDGQEAFPLGWYACPVHGRFEVVAKFRRTDGGGIEPFKLKLVGRRWQPASELVCPHCKRPLEYRGVDPLERGKPGRVGGGS